MSLVRGVASRPAFATGTERCDGAGGEESSESQLNQKYALMAGRILIHYMINGGFLCAGGEANRDNNYILDHVDKLKEIPVHIVHGRYDRVCHLYQAEALVRALRAVGNNEVNYFITMAG